MLSDNFILIFELGRILIKQANRQTNVRSNGDFVKIALQNLRLNVHLFACLLVCLLSRNCAKFYCYGWLDVFV